MSGIRLVIRVTNWILFKKLELREIRRDLSPGPSDSPLPMREEPIYSHKGYTEMIGDRFFATNLVLRPRDI